MVHCKSSCVIQDGGLGKGGKREEKTIPYIWLTPVGARPSHAHNFIS